MRRVASLSLISLIVVLTSVSADDSTPPETSALDLFEQRIMPIFRSPKPSSCVQCHLASVDLKDYIRPSHEETFLTLRDQGMIDLKQPSSSKILQLIEMGDTDRDAMARRIHAKTRRAEYEAFAAWIEACCNDSDLVSKDAVAPSAAGEAPVEVIRHARKDRVLDSFIRNVWSQRMRCFPCHTPHEIDADNPKHKKPAENYRKYVAEYGAKMQLFKETPLQTLRSLLASSRKQSKKRLPLINLQDPEKSLFVLKPTSKLPKKDADGKLEKPSEVEPVSHMGGLKMHVDDVSYKAVVSWIQDLADLQSERYLAAEDLPADDWYPSKQVLRMKEAPESWPVMSRVQFFVHAWNESESTWHQTPIAFTQTIVTPRRITNGPLTLLRHFGDDSDVDWNTDGSRLPAGKYLIKAYLDSANRLAEDPLAMLSADDYQGQVEVLAEWKEGFPNAQLISGNDLVQ